jgi:hypothetical protein
MMVEQTFFAVYGQPWLQALLGLRASDDPPRQHPGLDSDHMTEIHSRIAELREKMGEGGPREAAIRALVYVRMPARAVDERGFEALRRIRAEYGAKKTLAEFKQDLREQYFMLRLDKERAIAMLPKLLKGHEREWPTVLEAVRKIVTAAGPLGQEGKRRLKQLEELFPSKPKSKPRKRRPAKTAKKAEVAK